MPINAKGLFEYKIGNFPSYKPSVLKNDIIIDIIFKIKGIVKFK